MTLSLIIALVQKKVKKRLLKYEVNEFLFQIIEEKHNIRVRKTGFIILFQSCLEIQKYV